MKHVQDERLKVLNWSIKKILISRLRDKTTSQRDFVNTSIRLSNLLWEFTISDFETTFITSTKSSPLCEFQASEFDGSKFAIVSVYRSSESMTSFGPLQWESGISFAKILVQRDDSDPEKKPIFYYKNIPKNISEKIIFIADPMIATGGSIKITIENLLKEGAREENINCVAIICVLEGIQNIWKLFPKVKFYVAQVDPKLDENKYIIPGLGDFGDRFYNTCS